MGVRPVTVPQNLAQVLNAAGAKTGVDFEYLLQTAIRESSLDPRAKASTSTATGLFQFLEGTWLQVMKDEGPRLGYQHFANAITQTASGDFSIQDPALRKEVLKLREDPQIAADLAGAFTRKNGEYLRQRFGRMPSPGELYIAHFLGAHGAEKLFTAGLANPDQVAANLFPKQAKANPTIFYERGKARTIRQVYRALVSRHEVTPGADPKFTVQQMAAGKPAEKWPGAEAVPSRFGPADMSFTGLFSSEAANAPRPLISSEEAPQHSAFFTQLYGR
jgi:hypothetical protein